MSQIYTLKWVEQPLTCSCAVSGTVPSLQLCRTHSFYRQLENMDSHFFATILTHVQVTGARGTDHPPFSSFLFTNLFSIKFLYFFIISSSLFPYFNLFVSIFIQYYVNIKLHVSTLYRYYLYYFISFSFFYLVCFNIHILLF
jgi:hypothetical protein